MLFTSAWDPFPVRMQGAFLSEDEVERIVEHVKTLGKPEYIDDEIFIDDDDDDILQDDLEDPLMEKAIDIVVSARKASASYLQRRLKVGYNRAARMVEEMERMGIVGPQNGSKPRDILNVPDSAQ
jgi:S-DNA-T family DNA segregation ATPase FtsK/SpoIIIE